MIIVIVIILKNESKKMEIEPAPQNDGVGIIYYILYIREWD